VSPTVPTTPAPTAAPSTGASSPPGHAPENHVRLVDLVEQSPFNNMVQTVLVTIEAGVGPLEAGDAIRRIRDAFAEYDAS
jgi:hypothetical protein